MTNEKTLAEQRREMSRLHSQSVELKANAAGWFAMGTLGVVAGIPNNKSLSKWTIVGIGSLLVSIYDFTKAKRIDQAIASTPTLSDAAAIGNSKLPSIFLAKQDQWKDAVKSGCPTPTWNRD